MEDLRFQSGYALASIISFRNNDTKTSSLLFYKSCLFATRDLIMLEQGKFPIIYNEIVDNSKHSNTGRFSDLPEKAYKARVKRESVFQEQLIRNISYINDHIEPKLRDMYEGDSVILVD